METSTGAIAPSEIIDEAELRKRLQLLLAACAETVRPCRACGAMLYFLRTKNGKQAPYTATGLNHFADCPQRAQFKGGAR